MRIVVLILVCGHVDHSGLKRLVDLEKQIVVRAALFGLAQWLPVFSAFSAHVASERAVFLAVERVEEWRSSREEMDHLPASAHLK